MNSEKNLNKIFVRSSLDLQLTANPMMAQHDALSSSEGPHAVKQTTYCPKMRGTANDFPMVLLFLYLNFFPHSLIVHVILTVIFIFQYLFPPKTTVAWRNKAIVFPLQYLQPDGAQSHGPDGASTYTSSTQQVVAPPLSAAVCIVFCFHLGLFTPPPNHPIATPRFVHLGQDFFLFLANSPIWPDALLLVLRQKPENGQEPKLKKLKNRLCVRKDPPTTGFVLSSVGGGSLI